MTEAEWLACSNPLAMLVLLRGKVTGRKLRLFLRASGLHGGRDDHIPGGPDEAWGLAAQAVEEQLDLYRMFSAQAEAPTRELAKASVAALVDLIRELVGNPFAEPRPAWRSAAVGPQALAAYEERGRPCEKCKGAGSVTRRVTEAGVGYTLTTMCGGCEGKGGIDDGTLDPQRLAVLADALEEAGAEGELLEHLRGAGPHVRGCWAVDVCLGKS
jgi:hypothetical protein